MTKTRGTRGAKHRSSNTQAWKRPIHGECFEQGTVEFKIISY